MLFVSHDLEEVKQLTDRFTVFRDGQVVGGGATGDFTRDDIVKLIVGHEIKAVSHRSAAQIEAAEPVATIENARGGLLREASFTVHRGEILGVTGLSGSGFEDLPYVLFGAAKAESGNLTVSGNPCRSARRIPPPRSGRGWHSCPRTVSGTVRSCLSRCSTTSACRRSIRSSVDRSCAGA